MTPGREGKDEPREVRGIRPGDRAIRVRTRRTRLPLIERRVSGPLAESAALFRDVATQTPVPVLIGTLLVLVFIGPIPLYLLEGASEQGEVTSYWLALWWATAAFTTAGHSGFELVTTGGRVFGSIFTVVTIALFWGSVLAAFSSLFVLTWRRPKRQLVDTITYYLQRVDDLSAEELEDLEELTHGLLLTAKEQAQAEERKSTHAGEEPARAES